MQTNQNETTDHPTPIGAPVDRPSRPSAVSEPQTIDVVVHADRRLFFEWMRVDDRLIVHIYKPVEADIRAEERAITTACAAVDARRQTPVGDRLAAVTREFYRPPTTELAVSRQLDQLERRWGRQASRRITWRDGRRWPEIGGLLDAQVTAVGMDVFDVDVAYVWEADSWVLTFARAAHVGDRRVRRLVTAIVSAWDDLKFRWPKEHFGW